MFGGAFEKEATGDEKEGGVGLVGGNGFQEG